MKQIIATKTHEIEAAFPVECTTDNYIAIEKGSVHTVLDSTKQYYLIHLTQYNNDIWVNKDYFRKIA